MADRSNFRKMVDRTKPSKLRVFAESELQDCQDYFLEIQSDSTLPPNEIITASERLTLIRSEINLRHGDAKHGQTQRLARWAIGVGIVSIALAIISGVAQRLAKKPIQKRWPERRFWLAGDITVEPQNGNRVRVTFPLRYELRRGAKHSSGKVDKILVLEPAGDDLQIVAGSER